LSNIDFNTGYLAPGVYVQAIQSATPTIGTLAADVIAIVGPAQGWIKRTDSMTLSETTAKPLSQQGINQTTIVVTDTSGNIQAPSGYVVSQTGTAPATVTTIQLASGSPMTTTQTYNITYSFTDANYYTPQVFQDQNTLFSVYGQPFTTAGGVSSPLSLAGMLALQGASNVVIMPTSDVGGVATRTGLSSAYVALEPINGIDLIVPLPVGMTGTVAAPGDILNVASDLSAHCDMMSGPGVAYVRNGIVGYETGVTVAPDLAAASVNDMRIMLVWPNSFGYYNGQANQTFNVGGYYAAAKMAAILATQPVSQGLTRRFVSGFAGIPNSVLSTMTVPYKNQLSAAGVAVIEPAPSTGALWCRHGTTTNPSSSVTREFSLVRCSDAILNEFQTTYTQAAIIGDPITSTLLTTIQNLATSALEYLMNQSVIAGYTQPSVTQNTGNPDEVDVTFGYSPMYPLNILNVTYAISQTTGTVSPATASGTASQTSAYSGSTISSS
jgi:hypothetical protein